MPPAEKVNPQKWSDLTVLFDNGEYSIVSGKYEGRHTLGMRWNGSEDPDEDVGFPNQGGNPTWHVVPDLLERRILMGALDEIAEKVTGGGSVDEEAANRMQKITDELSKR